MLSPLAEKILNDLTAELERGELVLPSLPEVALRVRDVIEDEHASATRIAKEISRDAALSARLIQVANSPLLRGTRKIDSLEFAVTRMGNAMVRNVVNSLIAQQIFQPTTDITERLFREFWEHSTSVAAISHALAGLVRLKPDLALLAGLVHDIGALPIIKRAEDVPELLADEAMLIEVIRSLHTRIGEALLKKWDFPPELVEVAAKHEMLTYTSSGPADYVDVVIAANLQSYLGKSHPLAKVQWGTVPAFAKLGLDTEVSVIDMDETGDNIRELQAALRV